MDAVQIAFLPKIQHYKKSYAKHTYSTHISFSKFPSSNFSFPPFPRQNVVEQQIFQKQVKTRKEGE